MSAVAEVLKSVVHVLRTLLKKTPSETLLLDNYATVCLALDETIFEVSSSAAAAAGAHLQCSAEAMCGQGIVESTDRIEAL